MREITVKVYKFAELSNNAKDRAKQNYAELFGYQWADESLESMQKLAEYFGGGILNYSIDWFNCSHSSMSFLIPEDMKMDEIASRLEELGDYNKETLQGYGECSLTGVFCDDNAIDGFRKSFLSTNSPDLERHMQAAFNSWLKAGQADCEDFYKDEAFGEHCAMNNYEFYKDGRFYRERE